MGYHIILRQNSEHIEHHFVEKINDLANYKLTPDSIVYQGEKHWKPELLKNSSEYQNFAFDWHRAGIKAQELFKIQALKAEYILEELSQDKDSFKFYTGITTEYLKIKRGDFLIRNVKNIEVDVKCRSFYKSEKLNDWCFDFNVDHLERHRNMSNFTGSSVVIAIYQRVNTDIPKSDSLRMIEISHMDKIIKELKIKPEKRKNSKNEIFHAFPIPLGRTAKEFALIETIRDRG